MTKLDIGAGRKPKKGFQTIDVEAYANPTYLGDFRKMTFENIEEIHTAHLLEHFSRAESIEVLKQWHSWLQVGGIITITTPDFQGICNHFHTNKYWITRHAFGSQEQPWAFHKDGWYEDKFREILPKVGFEILSVTFSKSRKILPNITVKAKKI